MSMTLRRTLMQPGNQEDLEREILRQVKQRGSCYARDRFLDIQLGVATEEETVAWRQSFCERTGLEGRPYQDDDDPGGYALGTIFTSARA
ncbi:MAG: hypothetical protein M3Y28_04690 [Armatimonadota bacterium]|nr:hypothetical protein [Armatimonadota bacterium]